MKLLPLTILALAAMLAGCSPADQERAHNQAEKAKVQVKQDLRQADKKLSEGGEKLKNEVKKTTKKAMGDSGTRQ